MEKLYYKFDEKEVKNTLTKLFYFLKENNEDIEETSIFLADEYINGKIKLETYLQSINNFMHTFEMNENGIAIYEKLLAGVLKIKYYMIKNNNIDENIYELLIYIYGTNYNFEEIIKISKELLKINNKNKIAILHLVNFGKEIDYASKLIQSEFKTIESIPIWVGILNNYSKEIEPYIIYIRIKKDSEEAAKLLLEKYKESGIKIDENLLEEKNIIKKYNERINIYKKLIEELKPYNGYYIHYFIEKYNNNYYKTFEEFTESNMTLLKKTYKWHYELRCIEHINIALLQSNLGCAYLSVYEINNDIEYRNNAKKLFEESIKNYLNEEIISIFIKDPIINLVNIYDAEKEYKKAYDLIADIIYRPMMIFKDDCDLLLLEGEMYYKKDKSKKSAKKAIEDFRQANGTKRIYI